MAPSLYGDRDRASRERSISAFSDQSSVETATESKLNTYARYYGINLRSSSSASTASSDYAESVSNQRLARINELDDRKSESRNSYGEGFYTRGDDYGERASALVAARTGSVDALYRDVTPPRELFTPANTAAYRATSSSYDNSLSDVLSYTKSVLSSIRGTGNVRVHMNYRPPAPVYYYSPIHKHYHVYAPKNYYTTPSYSRPVYTPPPPIYHHHYHHPAKRTTEVTTRTYYVPLSAVPGLGLAGRSSAAATTSYSTSSRDESMNESESSSSYAHARQSASSALRESSMARAGYRGASMARLEY